MFIDGSDCIFTPVGRFNVQPGVIDTYSIDIIIIDDDALEFDETFTVVLTPTAESVGLVAEATHTVTILADPEDGSKYW